MINEMTAAIGHERQAAFLAQAEAARLARQVRGSREPRRLNLGGMLARAHGLTRARAAAEGAPC